MEESPALLGGGEYFVVLKVECLEVLHFLYIADVPLVTDLIITDV